jgi:hypothetical protein
VSAAATPLRSGSLSPAPREVYSVRLSAHVHRWLKKPNQRRKASGFIKKVTKDASDYEVKLRDLQRKAATLRKYQSDRAALVLARRKKKEQIFQHRSVRAIALEQSLRSTIVEFQISVKYHQGTHSPELEALIKKEMEWRTSQVPRAALIGKSFSP